ncbi:fibronectin type III-like domain-contianing protein [Streptomyces sp. 110]|uniref:Fibronectin type III-like domain-contianing protein n=1 Tax=Streptomyces endocoffeicus TaxID=2898945 RepID=A0ABS1Q1A0_9ACTN|nr:fibronectin type III-like domain-contianing protein [Streptomyces endocoffeicus]
MPQQGDEGTEEGGHAEIDTRGDAEDRPVRRLAGFASLTAAPGETAEATIPLPRRAAEIWDAAKGAWRLIPGTYAAEVGRSVADRCLSFPVPVRTTA